MNPQRPHDRPPFRPESAGDASRNGPDSQPAPASMSFVAYEAPPISVRAPASVPSSRLSQSSPGSLGGPASSRAPAPQSGPSSLHPASGVRRSNGGIYQTLRLLDKKHGSFFISRLILMTGINLRTFDSSTYDDPVAVEKLIKALRSLLPPVELEGLLPLLTIQR